MLLGKQKLLSEIIPENCNHCVTKVEDQSKFTFFFKILLLGANRETLYTAYMF